MSNDEDPESGLVLDIVPRLATLPDDDSLEPPLVHKRKNLCAHYAIHTAHIDGNAHTLVCSGCGADLDPYDYLVYLAQDGSRLMATRKRYRTLVKRVEELLAEERRVRARVKRWRAKDTAES